MTAESKVDSSSATLYSLTYTYDASGNRSSKYDGSSTESYTYDDANKLQSAGVKSYTYDDAGNTTSVYNSVSGITTSLTWDAEERMTGIANDVTPTPMWNYYTYNGLDQRVYKVGSGGGQIYTRADDAIDSPVLQDLMATYHYGAGNELISEVHDLSPTPQSRFYKSDDLGTTRAVRDDAGVLRDVLDCDAFGNALPSTMGNTQPPFGFAGKAGYQTDLDTGLMLLGHRFYDSSTGRFLSRDPVQDGYNWYVYCNNDPANENDPTGQDTPPIQITVPNDPLPGFLPPYPFPPLPPITSPPDPFPPIIFPQPFPPNPVPPPSPLPPPLPYPLDPVTGPIEPPIKFPGGPVIRPIVDPGNATKPPFQSL